MTAKANVVGGAMIVASGELVPIIADKGDQGMSAYQLWLNAGNVGTWEEYQASLQSKTPGPTGNSGWTPILAGELDGTKTMMKIVDWVGGSGTKPSVGMYIGTAGYVTTKAEAFNFNAVKRVMSFSADTNAQGIAAINFNVTPAFAVAPSVVIASVVPKAIAGATRAIEVTNTRTKTGVQVKVEQMNIVGNIVGLLSGATVTVIAIEL